LEARKFPRSVKTEIAALAALLQRFGPQLRRPYCDTLKGSKYANMKELRFTVSDGGSLSPSIPNGARFFWSAAANQSERAAVLQGFDPGCGRAIYRSPERRAVARRRQEMTVTLDEFMKDFTPKERAKVRARTAALIEQELTLRDLRKAGPASP
jgi:hypothetical protein